MTKADVGKEVRARKTSGGVCCVDAIYSLRERVPPLIGSTNKKGRSSRRESCSVIDLRVFVLNVDWFLMKRTREDSCNTNMLRSYRHIMYTIISILK